ncbi:glycerophosphodiester phosphodiesterase [Roseibacillus ishigakijimensis]|uniref:Glycerophosphodiester phosphodiesterase n=1 Tax=Roseibacillus ishigakijimensis TaxID=454146 RepID=A0A934RKJ2_9BACT|nr:glycerophosphodiester phosphodiesterase [Roseibacillus ishigakijimensis]MBK1833114.1 glycerophosphodiester phosphodiesterase [Roseibacillus ishigakijimensis]
MSLSLEIAVSLFIVAHRGASGDAPENTLPAFELAWEQGADAVEGDFHLTKDGHIVCIHDKDTARVAGKKLVVADSTLEELRELEVGSWKSPKYAGAQIPTIAEVLETVPSEKAIYIEVKCGPEIVPALSKTFEETDLEPEQLVVISFNADFVKQWKLAKPSCRTMLLVAFDKRRPRLTPSVKTVHEMLAETGANGLSTNIHPAIDDKFVQDLKEGGYEYHNWTLNEVSKAAKYLNLGSLSITTDFPATIRQGLQKLTKE